MEAAKEPNLHKAGLTMAVDKKMDMEEIAASIVHVRRLDQDKTRDEGAVEKDKEKEGLVVAKI